MSALEMIMRLLPGLSSPFRLRLLGQSPFDAGDRQGDFGYGCVGFVKMG